MSKISFTFLDNQTIVNPSVYLGDFPCFFITYGSTYSRDDC